MQYGDEASPSIISAGRALLVKMLTTVEPHGIFGSNFVYIFVFYHCPAIIVYNRLTVFTVLTVFYCQSVTIEALLSVSVSTKRHVYFSMDLCFKTDR